MATKGTINLLRSSSSISPDVIEWEGKFRLVSIISLVLVVVAGFVLGVLYSVLSSQKQSLADDKSRLIQQISAQSRKQALVTNIKFRLGLLDKIFLSKRQWEPVLNVIEEVAKPPNLKSFSISDTKLVSLTLFSDTFEETKMIVDTVLKLSTEKKMRNPTLETLQVDKDGKVQLSVSFFPAFSL